MPALRNQVAVPELEEDPALDLLRRLAPEACAADPAAASRLARAVGGLPLALELVGGFLAEPERSFFAELSAEAWGEMSDPAQRLQLATVRLGALDGRQVTLQETIALSLEHLPQPAVDAFHALGAFAPKPASFDLEAAKAVDARPSAATLATSGGAQPGGAGRPREPGPAPDHRRRGAHCAAAGAIERHRDYYLALVDEDREDWERIGLVYAQVQQALAWQVERRPDDGRLLDFYWSLRTYQERQGLWADYAGWRAVPGLGAGAQGISATRPAFLNVAWATCTPPWATSSRRLSTTSRRCPCRQVGDRRGEATTLNNIGAVYDDPG